MDVIKAQLSDPGAIGKRSPPVTLPAFLQQGATPTSSSVALADRINIQPLDVVAALWILVLEVIAGLDLTLERAVDSSIQPPPLTGVASPSSAPPPSDARPATAPPPSDARPATARLPCADGLIARTVGEVQAELATEGAVATGVGRDEVQESASSAQQDPGSGSPAGAARATSIEPGDGNWPNAAATPAGSALPVRASLPILASLPLPARLPALASPAPPLPASPPPPLPASRAQPPVAASPPLMLRMPPPVTATQAARLIIRLFVQALPPVHADPGVESVDLQKIETTFREALDRALAAVRSWQGVPESVVSEAELASGLVEDLLRDDPAAAIWLRSEWLGVATPMKRFWQRRRRARRDHPDGAPDRAPDRDFWAERPEPWAPDPLSR